MSVYRREDIPNIIENMLEETIKNIENMKEYEYNLPESVYREIIRNNYSSKGLNLPEHVSYQLLYTLEHIYYNDFDYMNPGDIKFIEDTILLIRLLFWNRVHVISFQLNSMFPKRVPEMITGLIKLMKYHKNGAEKEYRLWRHENYKRYYKYAEYDDSRSEDSYDNDPSVIYDVKIKH